MRRTRFMIEEENKKILELYMSGLSHRQIRDIVGLADRQYWKRIHDIQEKDLQILLFDQTKESRAFLHRRMLEKLQAYELQANLIAKDDTQKTTDRIAAFHLLRQLAADEYSLQTYGPSSFIIPELNDKLVGGSRETALILREAAKPIPEGEGDTGDNSQTDPSTIQ